ncbi:L-aminoadipate-semialdehyde dehydrogenase-phosphopantetheinyl transferase isoform X2 [Cajanus cajan]|uniref:holo-[acyl-carrier-protein] synthase n=1 Tax=Cajanus cajan TaxID=3821 RepID=A0A151RBU1_CAJCA|nr:L-aminoadipate-semialdehyde dehydrogenase-phosphopantetheinyl transferase isoform X2 [Cajanus cajan]KYP39865.1 L-aminoadipate-semialdehyde dehydrogenase-phosphopantetheinyl transferase [Cajanus cajan]
MEEGVRRWVVDISKWDPHPSHFSFLLSLLPFQHHSSVTRFVKMEDRKRALVSRMLQYALVHEVLQIPFTDILIKRTLEGKPYLDYDKCGLRFPNFNFNVSHHGDYVAIASEPVCLVGLDIVSYDVPQGETITEFIKFFSSYFSSFEWDNIVNAGTSDDVLIEFYRYWSLKEAYVKAIGSGLTEGLNKVEFSHTRWTNISVKVDGKVMTEWRFWQFELDDRHCVSIARVHPISAAMSYKATLRKVDFTEEEYTLGLHLPNVDIVELGVEQLISILHKALDCKHKG